MTLRFFALIGVIFGVLAAMMAFIITFGEYTHHYPDARTPRRLAMEAALVTFVFFLLMAMLAGVFFSVNAPD
jgi:hypothetical protein